MTRACLRLTRSLVGRTVAATMGVVLLAGCQTSPARAEPSRQYGAEVRACDQLTPWGAKVLCWGTAQHNEYQRRNTYQGS